MRPWASGPTFKIILPPLLTHSTSFLMTCPAWTRGTSCLSGVWRTALRRPCPPAGSTATIRTWPLGDKLNTVEAEAGYYGVRFNLTAAHDTDAALALDELQHDCAAAVVGRFYKRFPVAGRHMHKALRLDDMFLEEVAQKGRYIREQLEGLSAVEEVTGLGLMIGLRLKKDLAKTVEGCRDFS